MEVTDPSVSVELWRSSTQGETLPSSKICASFTLKYLQRWREESIINNYHQLSKKKSPWFASFSPRIVIPSATWWGGTDDTGSGESAKNDFACNMWFWKLPRNKWMQEKELFGLSGYDWLCVRIAWFDDIAHNLLDQDSWLTLRDL